MVHKRGRRRLRSRVRTIVVLVVAGFGVMASSGGRVEMATEKKGPQKVRIGRDSAGKVVRVSVGEELEVSLGRETSGAGYSWIPEKGYEQVLRLLRSEIREPSNPEDRGKPPMPGDVLGGSKERVLTFEVRSAGRTRLVILLRREWESPQESADRVEFTIEATQPR